MLKEPKKTGLIQVFTGNGKGKTTAALGTAMRAIARKWKIAFIYFDKGGSHYAERDVLKDFFSDQVSVFPTGLDRICPTTGKFRFGVTEEDRAEAMRGLEILKELFIKNEHDLIILDEINSTTDLGMLTEKDVLDCIKQKPEHMELILTGRNCPKSFMDRADLVTEMQLVKHYFYQGIKARDGIDF